MGTSSWSVDEITAMAAAVEEQASTLAGTPRAAAPLVSAFGHLLEPPATQTFPATTDDISSFVGAAATAVDAIADGLAGTADAYRGTEDQAIDAALRILNLVHGGGSDGGQVRPVTPQPAAVTPVQHWELAGGILEEGTAAGGDSFAGTNPLRVLVPAPLEWLNFPAAASELVASTLTWLAATVISYFGPFDDALTELAGDPDSVRAARASLDDLSRALGEHVTGMNSAAAQAPSWTGPAAASFTDHVGVERACMGAAEALVAIIGPSIEGVAQNTASARMMVVAMVSNVIEEIIRYITPNIVWFKVALGLLAVPFGFIVSGAILAALVADFIAWLLEFLATEMQVMADVMGDVADQGNGYLGQIRQLGASMARAGTALETGADPGTGYGVEAGSTADSMLSADHDGRDGVVMDLLAHRGDAGTLAEQGFTGVSDDPALLQELGLTPDMLVDDQSGFAAKIYRHEDGTTVVVFDGTDFNDPEQKDLLLENVPGGTGMGPQSQKAMAIADAIGDSPAQGEVVYGGHSLGGRLAAIASMTSGNPAITANAAGVSDATMEYIAQQNGLTLAELKADTNNGLIRGYRTEDDILTNLQEDWPIASGLMPDAPGATFNLGGELDPVSGHDSSNVVNEYSEVHGTGRPGRFTH